MLSRVVEDIQQASYNFGIFDKSETRKYIHEWTTKINQYYYNNTNIEITTMDNFGVRTTFVRPKMRTHNKVFRIVREYVFNHGNSMSLRDFIDELSDNDGLILKALKDKLDKSQEYVLGGFGEQHRDDYYNGHSFSIVFLYPEDIITKYGSLYCPLNGVVISKHKRSTMAVNPVHGKDVGFVFDTAAHIEVVAKSYQILCNKPHTTKEKYYFVLGGEILNTSIVNLEDKEPGIYIIEISKNISTGVTEDKLVKYINFTEVSNKNGVFTSEYDAMISLNPERSQRERENQHREKLHELEAIKFEYDMIRLENDKNKAEREKLKIELETTQLLYKKEYQEKETELLFLQAEVQRIKFEQDLILGQQNAILDDKKFEQQINKLNLEKTIFESTAYLEREKFLDKQEEQRIKHINTMLAHTLAKEEYKDRLNELSLKTIEKNKDHHLKMYELEAKAQLLDKQIESNLISFNIKTNETLLSEEINRRQHERKIMDETQRNISSGISLSTFITKLVG